MSFWTYISGIIQVSPLGNTQPQMRYILDTVLAHLPKVTGSEGDMNTYVIQKNGHNGSCSHDEFGQYSNLGNDSWKWGHPSFLTQTGYIIVVDAALRDRMFETTLKEFQKWLCRLAKRVDVNDVMVEVSGYDKSIVIRNYDDVYSNMFEWPSWCKKDGETKEPNWCEFMLYDTLKDSEYPMLLAYKYYNDEENDKEVERRFERQGY